MESNTEIKDHFTKREKDCLGYLVYGLTTKEIAFELGISPRTVEFYLNNIKDKMGCYCKSQLLKIILKKYAKIELNIH